MSSRRSDARVTSDTGDSRSIVDYRSFMIPVDVMERSTEVIY